MTANKSMNARSLPSFDLPTEDTLLVKLTGEWKLTNELPSAEEVMEQVKATAQIRRITFDTARLQGWDSGHRWALNNRLDAHGHGCAASDILTHERFFTRPLILGIHAT